MMRRRIFRSMVFVLFLMVVGVIGQVKVPAAETEDEIEYYVSDEGSYEYSVLDDGTIQITKYIGEDSNIEIPSQIDGKNVTVIGYGAFRGNNTIINVIVPEGIKILEGDVFFDCDNLMNITLPESLTEIGSDVFKYCGSLNNIIIPSGVTAIGDKYGKQPFASCGVESILVSSDNIAYKSVNGVLFNKSGTRLIAYPMRKKDKIYEIPDGVISIEESAFEENGLENIIFCDTVKSVGRNAFFDSYRLRRLEIPAGIEMIEESAFASCWSLLEINVDSANKNYLSQNGILFNKNMTELFCYPAGKLEKFYTIPSTVKMVLDAAFSGCRNLKSIIIPDEVIFIGMECFSNCAAECINLPQGLTRIKQYMFDSYLKSIVIPSSVKTIEWYAFYHTSKLENVYYAGSEEDWNKIVIEECNDYLSQATIHFNSSGPSEKYPTILCANLETITCSMGEKLNMENLEIIAIYSDGRYHTVTGYTTNLDSVDTSTEGEKELKVSYQENEKTIETIIKVIVKNNEVNVSDDNDPFINTTHTIIFHPNGDTSASQTAKSIKQGSPIGELPVPVRKSYTFAGWYTQKSGGTKVTSQTICNANQTFYARWNKVKKPSKVKSVSVKSKKSGKISVEYKKIKDVQGYEIFYSTDKKFKAKATKKSMVSTMKKEKKR